MSGSNTPAWMADLQPASWRGIPFFVDKLESTHGRNLVVHVYPKGEKDTDTDPDVEDTGRLPRKISFDAFFLNSPDQSIKQAADAIQNACDLRGPGELIHPTMGSVTARCMSLSIGLEKNGVLSTRMEFVLTADPAAQGQATQTTNNTDTDADVDDDADDLDDDADSDFVNDTQTALSDGVAIVGKVADTVIGTVNAGLSTIEGVVDTVSGTVEGIISDGLYIVHSVVGCALVVANIGIGLVNDAARAAGAVTGLFSVAGSDQWFGRYDGAGLASQPAVLSANLISGTPAQRTAAATALLLTASTNGRATVITAANLLPALAENVFNSTTAQAFASGISALTESIRASAAVPMDAIRLLVPLASFDVAPISGASTIAVAQNMAIESTAARVRRAALASMGRAIINYSPVSQGDAQSVFALISPLFDQEIQYAADNEDDASFAALRALKASVVANLQAKDINLPVVLTIQRAIPLPAAVIAWQQFADASRADQIVSMNDPANPLFLPTSIQVLSK